MRSTSSKLLHLGILALLLLGWAQQLCAQVDMLCNAEPVAAPTGESCHEAPTVPEPAPIMECCEAPDAVAAAPSALEAPTGSQPAASALRCAAPEGWVRSSVPPEAPPPDLLSRHCTLLL